MREFWLAWKDKKISLGRGLKINEDIILAKEEEDAAMYEINAVSFTSAAHVTAQFEFPEDTYNGII